MTTSYASLLKRLREEKNLSQAEVAKKAHMSRPSYVAVEKGTKELTLAEASALANLFGITVDELSRAQTPNTLKYKQMLLAFLREAKASKEVLKKTKLAKLLYLCDFAWFYNTGESVSGISYRKIAFGPVSDAYFRLVEEMEQKGELNIKQVLREDYHMYEIEETRASASQKLTLLSAKEIKLIQAIWKKWKDAKTSEIVGFTCNQLPYFMSNEGEIIPYELILQVDSKEVY